MDRIGRSGSSEYASDRRAVPASLAHHYIQGVVYHANGHWLDLGDPRRRANDTYTETWQQEPGGLQRDTSKLWATLTLIGQQPMLGTGMTK
jgi:hypothetical protein